MRAIELWRRVDGNHMAPKMFVCLAMEFAATALWADDSYRSAALVGVFYDFSRVDALATHPVARLAVSPLGGLPAARGA
jgi:hypothetical protein